MALAGPACLAELADEQLSVPTDKGANAGPKVTSLVAGMVAGADCIDDMASLRAAAEAFRSFEACPWTLRAEAELRATGEPVRRHHAAASSHLTPQERQIARLVANGMSSKEAPAQLFHSPRTVDYHLRKIFAKTGIASRTQLRDLNLAG